MDIVHPGGGGLIFQSPAFLPFRTVHGVFMARMLEWAAIPSFGEAQPFRTVHGVSMARMLEWAAIPSFGEAASGLFTVTRLS